MKNIINLFLILLVNLFSYSYLSAQEKAKDFQVQNQVDKKPVFSAGNINEYVAKHLQANLTEAEMKTGEKYLIEFVVTEEGSIVGVKFLQGNNKLIQAKIYDMLITMPKWIPAEKDGKKVNAYFTLPIQLGSK